MKLDRIRISDEQHIKLYKELVEHIIQEAHDAKAEWYAREEDNPPEALRALHKATVLTSICQWHLQKIGQEYAVFAASLTTKQAPILCRYCGEEKPSHASDCDRNQEC